MSNQIEVSLHEQAEVERITIQDQEVHADTARPAFRVETITTLPGMLALEHEWDDLASRSGSYSIFSSFLWNLNWAKHLGTEKELHIITVRRNNRLIGLAPLMIGPLRVAAINVKALQFMGAPLNDYAEFLLGEDKELTLQLIWDRILAEKERWGTISLEEIPEHSATLQLSEQLLNGMGVRNSTIFCNDTYLLELSELDQDAFQRHLKKREVDRYIRKLERASPLRFNRILDLEEARKALSEHFSLHAEIREKKGDPSLFVDQRHQDFAFGLIDAMHPAQEYGIWKLTQDGTTLAILQGFIHDHTLFGYFKSYNLDYAKLSPGMIATKYLIETAAAEGLRRIDFSRGTDPFKEKIASRKSTNKGIVVTKTMLNHLFQKGYHLAKERIMANPSLHARMNALRSKPVFRNLF